MAFDEYLAERMRLILKDKQVSFEEKRMMGGLTFMVDQKMCVGIVKNNLMARIDPEIYEESIRKPGCRAMDFTGRPMKGFVFIEPEGIDLDDDLGNWIQLTLDYNPKAKSSKKARKKAVGIGGVFFKSKDPGTLKAWYQEHLGLVTNEYGSLFEFRHSDEASLKGYLQWSPFDNDTTYFQPSDKEFMINYRVENLESIVQELKSNGVNILDEIEVYEYGKFVHILDPENNKIELWEPVDQVFTDLYDGKTTK